MKPICGVGSTLHDLKCDKERGHADGPDDVHATAGFGYFMEWWGSCVKQDGAR